MAIISKKEVEHLAELSRLDFSSHEEEKLAEDLQKILAHFEELKEVDTSAVLPLTGGSDLSNSFREDVSERTDDTGKGRNQFPDEKDGFLKVPAIM